LRFTSAAALRSARGVPPFILKSNSRRRNAAVSGHTLCPTQIMHRVGPNLKRNQLRRVVIKFQKLWMRRFRFGRTNCTQAKKHSWTCNSSTNVFTGEVKSGLA